MQEELVSFETAELAKEKGFNLEKHILYFYTKPKSKMFGVDEHGRNYPIKNTSKKLYSIGSHITLRRENVLLAPTQSLLQTWLRNVKGIEITIIPNYIYIVFPLKRMTDALDKLEKDQTIDLLDLASETEYKTYEEALEVALIEALKLI
jgi:hypothetical protein